MKNNDIPIHPVFIWTYYILLAFCISFLQIHLLLALVLSGDVMVLNLRDSVFILRTIPYLVPLYVVLIHFALKYPLHKIVLLAWCLYVLFSSVGISIGLRQQFQNKEIYIIEKPAVSGNMI